MSRAKELEIGTPDSLDEIPSFDSLWKTPQFSTCFSWKHNDNLIYGTSLLKHYTANVPPEMHPRSPLSIIPEMHHRDLLHVALKKPHSSLVHVPLEVHPQLKVGCSRALLLSDWSKYHHNMEQGHCCFTVHTKKMETQTTNWEVDEIQALLFVCAEDKFQFLNTVRNTDVRWVIAWPDREK